MRQISFVVDTEKGILFVRPEVEELGFQNRHELETNLMNEEVPELIRALDLSKVQLIDSSTLGVLLKANEALNLRGQKLIVFGLNTHVQGVMTLTRMHFILNLKESREAVIEEFGIS